VFEDLHLVPEDGHAVAVFSAGPGRRAAIADALSWHVNRRFQAGADEAETVLELRATGALADLVDEHRGAEGLAPVRLSGVQVRLLLGAISAYVSERDVDGYQPPEERDRIAEMSGLVDPLFDLALQLDRADEVLDAQSY
jgi:hypothetical protein